MPSLLGFLPIGLLFLPSPSYPQSWKHAHTSPAPCLHWALWSDSWLCHESPSLGSFHIPLLWLCPRAVLWTHVHVLTIAHPSSASRKFCLYHLSDYAKGFGGKYGVQKDRMDKVRPGAIVGMFFQGPWPTTLVVCPETLGTCHSMVLGSPAGSHL